MIRWILCAFIMIRWIRCVFIQWYCNMEILDMGYFSVYCTLKKGFEVY